MAQPATTVWEVRPTVGSDSNGGGFVPGASGTDWSQQTSPQYALTGVTSSGSGNTVLSSSAAADMVGNIAQCTGGTNFNTGFFEVTSVSVGVSITFGTNAGGSSICSGTGSAGVINIGGALATIKILFRSIYSATQAVSGNTIYIKATGSLVVTASQQNYDCNFVTLIGYTTTRGDNGQATITTATNSVYLFSIGNSGMTSLWYNIKFTNTAGTPSYGLYNAGNSFGTLICQNCLFDGFTYGVYVAADYLYHGAVINCEVRNCTTIGMYISNPNDLEFDACYIHGNAAGIQFNTGGDSARCSVRFNRTVVYNNTAYGVERAGNDGGGSCALSFWNSAIVSNGTDGINIVGTSALGQILFLFNTIVVSNGGYGVNASAAGAASPWAGPAFGGANNAYYGNTSGARHNFPSLPGDVTLTASPFTDPSTGDFTLNTTSGGGPLCEAAGFPSALP